MGNNQSAKLRLSPGQSRVLHRIAYGERNKQIAHDLGLTIYTVNIQRRLALANLGAKTAPEAVRIAIQHGLIPLGAEA